MILHVEDDADDKEFFKMVLSQSFKTVLYHQTSNGVECLEFLAKASQLPQLIVADINMPLMNGYELMRKLRKDDRYKDIPIIAFSTAPKQAEVMALKMGADRFYSKPPVYDEYQKLVKSFLSDYLL